MQTVTCNLNCIGYELEENVCGLALICEIHKSGMGLGMRIIQYMYMPAEPHINVNCLGLGNLNEYWYMQIES